MSLSPRGGKLRAGEGWSGARRESRKRGLGTSSLWFSSDLSHSQRQTDRQGERESKEKVRREEGCGEPGGSGERHRYMARGQR